MTYTNGMRLPSTAANRSHDVNWVCDPEHRGWCDCQMYSPCRNEARAFPVRSTIGYVPHGQAAQRVDPSTAGHALDGVEHADSERLGVLPLDAAGAPRLSPGDLPSAGPTGPEGVYLPGLGVGPTTPQGAAAGENWYGALQTLGAKMLLGDQRAPLPPSEQ